MTWSRPAITSQFSFSAARVRLPDVTHSELNEKSSGTCDTLNSLLMAITCGMMTE